MEAAGLGLFMVSAAVCTILIEHPAFPVRSAIASELLRRLLIGLAMGLTAMALIYSPLGKRSGAHLNPAVTLTFWALGKMDGRDAVGYVLAQCVGGTGGLAAAATVLGTYVADPNVNYVVTVPGAHGPVVAFLAELAISFGLMMMVLTVSNRKTIARYTGVLAGCLVATYITLEAPLSGMSMNPARTLASAVPAWIWAHFWVYFLAPPIGMLLAAQTYLWTQGPGRVLCAKLHHDNPSRCIFHCRYGAAK
jgi:aquaporin Z